MLPDIDTLAKLLQNADSPKPRNYMRPPEQGLTNKDVYAPDQVGNILPSGVLPDGRIPSELARYLRSLLAGTQHPDIPKSPQGGNDGR